MQSWREPRQLQNLQADSVVPTGFMNLGQAETPALHLLGDVLIFRTTSFLLPSVNVICYFFIHWVKTPIILYPSVSTVLCVGCEGCMQECSLLGVPSKVCQSFFIQADDPHRHQTNFVPCLSVALKIKWNSRQTQVKEGLQQWRPMNLPGQGPHWRGSADSGVKVHQDRDNKDDRQKDLHSSRGGWEF